MSDVNETFQCPCGCPPNNCTCCCSKPQGCGHRPAGSRQLPVDKHDRSSYFPKIEAKYGQPMKYWFGVMKDIADRKYPEQIAYLKEEHGFSQAHANALVMYSRGSKSSRRFDSLEDFLKKHDAVKQKTVKKIFKVIQKKYPFLNHLQLHRQLLQLLRLLLLLLLLHRQLLNQHQLLRQQELATQWIR